VTGWVGACMLPPKAYLHGSMDSSLRKMLASHPAASLPSLTMGVLPIRSASHITTLEFCLFKIT
jgi:hypothetical protein